MPTTCNSPMIRFMDPADINEDERRRRSSKACLPALLRSACPLRHADPLEEDEDDKRKRLSPRGLPPSDAKQASPPIERAGGGSCPPTLIFLHPSGLELSVSSSSSYYFVAESGNELSSFHLQRSCQF
ncbi:hypothetical protein OPV22_033423 [Ensete ventricosum]|uniref:Uncharacterized protein n=1 Tax=Ensete ventricosum TaxID=4639 RepID=A0AAV8PZG0_ENSVE|nr:hypothetical protein OPV22_033423 [Ensete ventricosum]